VTPGEFEQILDTDHGDGLRNAGRKALAEWRALNQGYAHIEALLEQVLMAVEEARQHVAKMRE
jgi:hypothetical protein